MYYARPVARRCPASVRIVQPTRSASFFPTPFFARSPAAEFNSLFRALDDITGPRALNLDQVFAPVFQHQARQSQQLFSFTPKFDVQETAENYELRGEIPGVENENLSVEFTDGQTLTIRGQIVRESSTDTPPTSTKPQSSDVTATETEQANTVAADTITTENDNSDAASTYSTGSYQKPSVEDSDMGAEEPESSADAQARLTPTTSTPVAQEQGEPRSDANKQADQQQPESRYWISERSSGSFQRTFKFPSRVDQDAVKASLKNGILSIIVPKAAAPVARIIAVE